MTKIVFSSRGPCSRFMILITFCVASSSAFGQTLEAPKSVGVRERARPEYSPYGIRLGGFTAFPSLTLSSSYDDNIYATDMDEVSDMIWGVGERLELNSNWSTHSLSLFAAGNSSFYSRHSSQSHTDWQTGGEGTVVVTNRLNVSFDGDYDQLHEPREDVNSPEGIAEPIAYAFGEAGVSVTGDLSPLKLSVGGNYESYDYSAVPLTSGGTLSESFRDHEVWTVTGRAAFEISPDTSLFLQGSSSKRAYSEMPPAVPVDRNAWYREYLAGASFDVTNLMKGEIGLGYFTLNNADPGQSDREGFAVKGGVQWFVTQLMTISVNATRTTNESGLVGSASYVETRGEGRVDYELLRNLILSAGGSYERDEFTGIDREDSFTTAEASARWLLNRHATFVVGYTFDRRDSQGAQLGPKFKENLVTASLKLAI